MSKPEVLYSAAGDDSSPQRHGHGEYSNNSGSHNTFGSHNSSNSHNTASNSHNTNSYSINQTYYNQIGEDRHEDYPGVLPLLYKSGPRYNLHRDRVQKPAEGTCTWVTKHQTYKDWLAEKTSSLLWLSADAGCGKSVIASFLVGHLEGREGTTVCYFFFNDDYPEQRRATSALCAILHQLFRKKRRLCKFAAEELKDRGKEFTREVGTLWNILVKAVAEEEECGDVICVVDALDECEGQTRSQLMQHLKGLPRSQTPGAPLKFLVTSRPYHKIVRELGAEETTMRLKGEDEVEAIKNDVARFIDDGIKKLESMWQHKKLGHLRGSLIEAAGRTFIWVSVVIEILKDSDDFSEEKFTHVIGGAPKSLEGVYTKMLDKIQDLQKAQRMLHIVVGAARPLTVRELYVAFGITRDCKIKDLDSGHEQVVKNICGLFVRVVDSKVYLIHHTAREFLIKRSEPGQGKWQHTLCPKVSNFTMADACITYLLLEDFKNDQLAKSDFSGSILKEEVMNYVQKYALVEYAASHWGDHFQDLQDRQMELFERARLICEGGSNVFLTWFRVYWVISGQDRPFPTDFTHLMIASWFGQELVVEQLLEEGGDINARSKQYGTALNIAALRKDEDITRMLLEKNAEAYIGGKAYNILHTKRSEVGDFADRADNESHG